MKHPPPPTRYGPPGTGQTKPAATAEARLAVPVTAPSPPRHSPPPTQFGSSLQRQIAPLPLRPGIAVQRMLAKPQHVKKLADIRKGWVEEIEQARLDYIEKISVTNIGGAMTDSLMTQINDCLGIIRGATDNFHKTAAEPAYAKFQGLCGQLNQAISKMETLDTFKKVSSEITGVYYETEKQWDGEDLTTLYQTYKQNKKNLEHSKFEFQDGKFKEKIRIISFEDFAKSAPIALIYFIKHLYLTFHNKKSHEFIIDNRSTDEKLFGTLNSSLPGAMRSQHMNQSGALPDISKLPLPEHMIPLDKYVATFSGVPHNVLDKGTSVGYVEYTAPGMSKHEGRVIFDYKQGRVYVNASHYGYFHRAGPKEKPTLVESGQSRNGQFVANEEHGNEKNPFFLILPPKIIK